MNPPFQHKKYIDHFQHAWQNCLQQDGVLLGIAPKALTLLNDAKTRRFRELVMQHGRIVENDEQAFDNLGTAIRTVLLAMHLPKHG